MNKAVFSTVLGLTVALSSFVSQASESVGVGVNYGLFSGPTLELTYPINDSLQVRGALSSGMGLTETTSDTDIDYDVQADGSIHRLALDYHPFAGSFFVSAGYAFNNFKLNADGTKTATDVKVGNDSFNGTVNIKGNLEWDSAPTLSLGWGHSPAIGWGAMFEVGAIFTGAPDVSLSGTLAGNQNDLLDAALKDEEIKLKNDVGDYDFLPVLQAGVTYRF